METGARQALFDLKFDYFLHLDAGYVGARKIVEGLGYKAHIRGRGEEREEKKHNPEYEARRKKLLIIARW
jgi:hypothetical protein